MLRSLALLALVLLALEAAATAQEAATCSGESEPVSEPAAAPAAAPTVAVPPECGPRWADVALAAIVVAVGAGGLLYIRANERRRRRLAAPAPPVDAAPYLAGGALGLLFGVSLLVRGRPVGISGGILQAAGVVPWTGQAWIVIGVVAGAFAAALATGGFRISVVPGTWAERHGPSVAKRWLVTFLAAALMEVAAAIAGGCTSGLALSGGVALAPGAFVFMAAMFATGMPAARLAHGDRR